MQIPRISAVVRSYKQGKFIEETILSILNQKCDNAELIVINGGSTDNSIDIIRKYEGDLVYWCSEKDDGQLDAINRVLMHATVDIFCWLNSDDMFEPEEDFYGTRRKLFMSWTKRTSRPNRYTSTITKIVIGK